MAASLSNALSSLRTSTNTLSSSLSILDTGIADLPRLSKVLAQTRHFELLPASTLAAAQSTLISEIRPEVEALLARVEAEVEKLERREQGLRARWELQEGRLGREPHASGAGSSASAAAAAAGGMTAAREKENQKQREKAARKSLGPRQEAKARQMRQKKERLSYAVERLTLQAQQTERQLRKSMAAQEVKSGGRKPEDSEEDIEF